MVVRLNNNHERCMNRVMMEKKKKGKKEKKRKKKKTKMDFISLALNLALTLSRKNEMNLIWDKGIKDQPCR